MEIYVNFPTIESFFNSSLSTSQGIKKDFKQDTEE